MEKASVIKTVTKVRFSGDNQKQTDEQIDGQTDRQMVRQTDFDFKVHLLHLQKWYTAVCTFTLGTALTSLR